MRAILYKGQSQYDALRLFIDHIAAGLIESGLEVKVIDLLEKDSVQQINAEIRKGKIDFFLSFNGMGVNFTRDDGRSIYEVVGSKFVSLYVDHPLHHLERLLSSPKNTIATFIDRDHLEFAKAHLDIGKFSAFAFLPHGGAGEFEASPCFEDGPLKIMFSGSFKNDTLKKWRDSDFDIFISGIVDEVWGRVSTGDNISIDRAVSDVIDAKGLSLRKEELLSLKWLCFSLIAPLRTSRNRESILGYFSDKGIEVDVYGPVGWAEKCESSPFLNYKGQITLEEAIRKHKDYHFVINDNNDFTDGSHERVFNSLLSGAVPISPRNKFYEEMRGEVPGILFDRNTMEGLPGTVEEFKEVYQDQRKLIGERIENIRNNHSWVARSKNVIGLVKLSSLGL